MVLVIPPLITSKISRRHSWPAKEINLESVGDSGTTDVVSTVCGKCECRTTTKIERPKTFEEIQREKQVLLFKFERLRKRGFH